MDLKGVCSLCLTCSVFYLLIISITAAPASLSEMTKKRDGGVPSFFLCRMCLQNPNVCDRSTFPSVCRRRKGQRTKLNYRRNFFPGFQIDKDKVLTEWEQNVNLDKLSDDHKLIHNAHINAVKAEKEVYTDPFTGFEVFTIRAHINRGYCCGNACRHCPFQQVMVDAKYKNLKIFNTAFYA